MQNHCNAFATALKREAHCWQKSERVYYFKASLCIYSQLPLFAQKKLFAFLPTSVGLFHRVPPLIWVIPSFITGLANRIGFAFLWLFFRYDWVPHWVLHGSVSACTTLSRTQCNKMQQTLGVDSSKVSWNCRVKSAECANLIKIEVLPWAVSIQYL